MAIFLGQCGRTSTKTSQRLVKAVRRTKARLNKECKRNISQPRTYDLIELALSSDANLAVIPLQDYMCLSNEQGRINTPSKAEGNWDYRLSPRYNTPTLRDKIKHVTKKTKRTKKAFQALTKRHIKNHTITETMVYIDKQTL